MLEAKFGDHLSAKDYTLKGNNNETTEVLNPFMHNVVKWPNIL